MLGKGNGSVRLRVISAAQLDMTRLKFRAHLSHSPSKHSTLSGVELTLSQDSELQNSSKERVSRALLLISTTHGASSRWPLIVLLTILV